MKYRAEIDGLRALAVMPVVLFHAGMPGFSGGFVGVDVFFVISGYLITAKIHEDLQQGRFSLLDFYERRARRILPLLLCVILASLLVFQVLLTPSDYARFVSSIISALDFTSEFFFSRSGSYFDAVDYPRPLLHTWSLSIEEKYYVLFPLLFMAIVRKRPEIIPASLGIATLVFLGFSVWLTYSMPEGAYYNFFARIWEILVGANIAIHGALIASRFSGRGKEALAVASMAGLACCLCLYDKYLPYPGLYALVPALCTSGIVVAATHETWLGKVLALRPLVFIGLLSYSIYMWHQPVIVAADEAGFFAGPLMWATMAAIPAVSYLSWRFVEQPFRSKRALSTGTFAAVMSVCLVVVIAGSDLLESYGDRQLEAIMPRDTTEAQRVDTCFLLTADRFDPACTFSMSPGHRRALLIGDSHAAAVYPPLHAWADANGIDLAELTAAYCLPLVPQFPHNISRTATARCAGINGAVRDQIAGSKPDLIIVAAYMYQWSAAAGTIPLDELWSYDRYYGDFLQSLADLARSNRVVVIGQVPVWRKSLPDLVALDLRRSGGTIDRLPLFNGDGLMKGLLAFNDKYRRDVERSGATYVSVIDGICPNGRCPRFATAPDGKLELTTFDYGHLSLAGGEYVTAKVLGPALAPMLIAEQASGDLPGGLKTPIAPPADRPSPSRW